jgi:N5-(carboxyethyl)ornithine synthase
MVYDRRTEKQFQKDLGKYDVLVNGILWDTSRTDHIVYREDLKRMRPGSLIIDISCDTHGGIESSEATTIEDPIYVLDGVTHYVVDHTPALFYKTVTESLSAEVVKYLDELIEDRPGKVLLGCRSIHEGKILDQRIIDFQHR